jgi:hypothetical protein
MAAAASSSSTTTREHLASLMRNAMDVDTATKRKEEEERQTSERGGQKSKTDHPTVVLDPTSKDNLEHLYQAAQAVASAEGTTPMDLLQFMMDTLTNKQQRADEAEWEMSPDDFQPETKETTPKSDPSKSLAKFYCDKCNVIVNVAALVDNKCPLCVKKERMKASENFMHTPNIKSSTRRMDEPVLPEEEELPELDPMAGNFLLTYGKHQGETFSSALMKDPAYCKWILENENSLVKLELRTFALFLKSKVTLFRPAGRSGANYLVNKDTQQTVAITKTKYKTRTAASTPASAPQEFTPALQIELLNLLRAFKQ